MGLRRLNCEAFIMTSGYETGMKVTYDPGTRRVIVAFRGRIIVLPDLADTETTAIAEGEAYCRRHGWTPSDKGSSTHKVRSAW